MNLTSIRNIFTVPFLLLYFTVNAQQINFSEPLELARGMEFPEGPAWHPDGYLVFSDINGNVIYKWSETTGLDTLLFPAGNSNGIVCTKTNDFIVCRHGARDLVRMNDSGNLATIINSYNGKKLNSPNDVTLSYKGSIYFTDPDYGVSQNIRELNFHGLYCIPNNSNLPVLLDSTLVKPNGLTFASDWRTLYVNESSTNKIYSYFLRDECILKDLTKDKKVFIELDKTGEVDGITADVYGNIFVAFGNGGIKIFDKDANPVGNISFPSKVKVRNLCFGGKFQNLLFVTAGSSLYQVEIRYYGKLITPGILGIPTNKSVVFNAISDQSLIAFVAYGKNENNLNMKTVQNYFQKELPIEITLDGLEANTRYFYEFCYKKESDTDFTLATQGTFMTQRSKGESFTFAVEADPHLDESSNYTTFRNMLKNAAAGKADFLIDLGDNFMTEKFPVFNEYYVEQRNLLYRHFWDETCKSMPLFIVNGNHEGELRWKNNMMDIATKYRKQYYPTPSPNGFYTGSETVEQVGLRENYYAWHWGDALFVVLDVYGYTQNRTDNPWCFTLGKNQYDWFAETLEKSTAKYKFVFSHQLVGGNRFGRGGAEMVDFFEMGGKNADGTFGFYNERAGWEKPLHQLMVENGVQIFFHGHDHFYAEQEKEGIVYQLVPQPSFPGYTEVNDAENYGYLNGVILPNSGHLQVTVMKDSARVDYIGAYHTNNQNKGLVNSHTRRTYHVKPNNFVNSVNVANVTNKLGAWYSENAIVVKSDQSCSAKVSLISVDGKNHGMLLDGMFIQGINKIPIQKSYKPGIYFLLIQTNKTHNTIKLVL